MTTANHAGILQADIDAVGRIEAVPTLLRVLCDVTGMGFAAVARVTEHKWIACAVFDRIGFGLAAGDELDIDKTVCKESRERSEAIVIDQVSTDARYCGYKRSMLRHIESYVSVPIRLPDGEYFGNLCAVDPAPRKVSDPHIQAMFVHFADMIAFQLAVERTRDQAMAAMVAERARNDLREQFVAMLGHDMRQPVLALAECSRALQSSSADGDVFAATARIGGYARRLIGLIDDMLDLAKVDLGQGLAVRMAPDIRLEPLLRDAVDELLLLHPGREVVLTCDALPTIGADRTRLLQVVTNLVANALEHGGRDSAVGVHAARIQDDVVITVSNRGQPISPADMGLLFEPFWRKSSLGRRDGIGLGLYICNQIVRAHGGHLEVDSDEADGTHFTAVLPVHQPARRAGPRATAPESADAGRAPPQA